MMAGRTTTAAAAAARRRERVRNASNMNTFDSSTQSEPPKTPVQLYHCTAHTSPEKPCPSISHGNVMTSAE